MKATITTYGGAGSVTGANFMLSANNTNVLVDCGLIQGQNEARNAEEFQYNPTAVEALFVTHAHIDHIGRIPKLVRDGFSGPIYSTPPTKALAQVMLRDALSVMRYKHEAGGPAPIYEQSDIDKALTQWKTAEYGENISAGDIQAQMKNAGHILGSAMVEIRVGNSDPVLFTGDLGNPDTLLIPTTESPGDARYVLMESVYGDRLHERAGDRKKKLREIIQHTVDVDGELLIPAFSLERTQVMLYELNELIEAGEVPQIPVYLDSPLAIEVTEVYSEFTDYFNEEVRDDIASGDDIFSFSGLNITRSTEESKAINREGGAKIIIAGAGMSHGGRIIFHEKEYLPKKSTTLLIVGYQVPGSLGRRLLEGAKEITIEGRNVPVHARIERLHGYSAHADREDLLTFVKKATKTEQFIVAMGELSASSFLAQRIHDYVGKSAHIPQEGERIEIEI
ncbi:MAG: MBL fold metallo-hydrolase [Candidatus Paceibacterota bacterium]